jgi:hypothetical protein
MVREHAGGYDLELAGFTVNICAVDMAFTLHFIRPPNTVPHQEHAHLRIEGLFELAIEGATSVLTPGPDPVALAPALGLLFRTVESAAVDPAGVLEMTFSGPASLRLPPDPNYEAWTLNVLGKVLVVCGPEGLLSIFGPPHS